MEQNLNYYHWLHLFTLHVKIAAVKKRSIEVLSVSSQELPLALVNSYNQAMQKQKHVKVKESK